MGSSDHPPHKGLRSFVKWLNRLGIAFVSVVECRDEQLIVRQVQQLRREIKVFACALAAALFVCITAGFAGLAVITAFGDSHRIAGYFCVASAFVLLAGLAMLLARKSSRVD